MTVELSCEPAFIYLHHALSLSTAHPDGQRQLIGKVANRLMRDRQGFINRQSERNYIRVVRIAIKAQVIFCKDPIDQDAAHELLLKLEKLVPTNQLKHRTEEDGMEDSIFPIAMARSSTS